MMLLLLISCAFSVVHSKEIKALRLHETPIKSSGAGPELQKADHVIGEKLASKELKDIITDSVESTDKVANKELGVSKSSAAGKLETAAKTAKTNSSAKSGFVGATMVFTYAAYQEAGGRIYQIDRASFNSRFWAPSTSAAFSSGMPIIVRRDCATCNPTTLYYRRLTVIPSWDAYENFLCNWNSANNTWGVDFLVFTSLNDAISSTPTASLGSVWGKSCATPVIGNQTYSIGFPGNCTGAASTGGHSWSSISTTTCGSNGNGQASTFFLYEAGLDVVGRQPTPPPTNGMLAWFQSEFIDFYPASQASQNNPNFVTWPSSVSYFTGSDDLAPVGTFGGSLTNPGSVTIGVSPMATYGASLPVKYISGSATQAFRFGTILNSNFTICSVTRYTNTTMGRLLRGTDTNFLHGHWNGYSGVAYYAAWATNPRRNKNSNNWVVLCGGVQSSFLLETGNLISGGLQVQGLGVNVGGCCWADEPSQWAIMELAVWNRKLTDQEMATASQYFQWKLEAGTGLNSTRQGTTANPGVPLAAAQPKLVVPTEPSPMGMVSWFKSENAPTSPGGSWSSSVGGFTGGFIGGGASSDISGTGRGAYVAVKYVSGTTSTTYSFGQVLPPTHTVCSVSRYNAAGDPTQMGSILVAVTASNSVSNWTHGHYRGQVGVAIYDGVARNVWWQKNINSTHWTVLCGSNGGGTVYEGQLQIQSNFNASIPVPANRSLQINPSTSSPFDRSTWSVMEGITWNRALSAYEMGVAGRYLTWKLRAGSSATIPLGGQTLVNR